MKVTLQQVEGEGSSELNYHLSAFYFSSVEEIKAKEQNLYPNKDIETLLQSLEYGEIGVLEFVETNLENKTFSTAVVEVVRVKSEFSSYVVVNAYFSIADLIEKVEVEIEVKKICL